MLSGAAWGPWEAPGGLLGRPGRPGEAREPETEEKPRFLRLPDLSETLRPANNCASRGPGGVGGEPIPGSLARRIVLL